MVRASHLNGGPPQEYGWGGMPDDPSISLSRHSMWRGEAK